MTSSKYLVGGNGTNEALGGICVVQSYEGGGGAGHQVVPARVERHAGDGSGVSNCLEGFLSRGLTIVEQFYGEVIRATGQYRFFWMELQCGDFLQTSLIRTDITASVADLQVVVQRPDDWVAGLVHVTPALGVRLGQHPVHIQYLDTGVHTTSCAELAVPAERPAAAVPLVAGHVGRLQRIKLSKTLKRVSKNICIIGSPFSRSGIQFPDLLVCGFQYLPLR